MTIRQALVFAILMENNDGVIDKAPSYMSEKLGHCGALQKPEVMLDDNNLAKFKEWQERWGVNFDEEGGSDE